MAPASSRATTRVESPFGRGLSADGAVGARFLNTIAELLQYPDQL
ncbi:hypothetical protein AB0L63_30030 [Nocardia sp. NPDC051990]